VVIREGAEIPLRLSFTNLSRAELGLLLTALGQHPQHPFCFKLGGGKPVGLGSVEAHVEEVVLLSGGDALKRAGRLGGATERLADDKLKQRIGEWVVEAEKEQVLLPDKLKEVAETLHRDKLNQPAPSGLY
jgi:CRISPR/Cas system CSM-associated protein Csm3 (group 7 of RAMP superfamily)